MIILFNLLLLYAKNEFKNNQNQFKNNQKAETNPELPQTSKMEHLAIILNGF